MICPLAERKYGVTRGFPVLKRDGLDSDQRMMWDQLTLGPRGFYTGGAGAKRLPDLYNAWLHFPEFGLLMLRLADEIRARSEFSGKLRELVILTTSMLLNSRVEYDFHAPLARNQGLSDAVVSAIGEGSDPPFTDDTERVIYQANVELVRTATLADEAREEVVRSIGHRGLMQLVAAVGLYIIVCHTSNVAGVQLADDFSADAQKLNAFYSGKATGR